MMKRSIVPKLLSVLCVFFIVFPVTPLTVSADQYEKKQRDPGLETVDGWFAFETQRMDVKAGGSATQTISAWADYDVHWTGHTSKKTYIECSFKSGTQKVTFHVGEDETAKRVTFYFYVADAPYDREIYQPVDIDISYPAPSNPATSVPLTKSAPGVVPYLNGKSGVLTTALDDQVGLLADAGGAPRAAFAVVGSDGKISKLQVYETVNVQGFSFPAVHTLKNEKDVTVMIQDADKAAAQAVGIYGLYVNERFVFWP